MVSAIDRFYRLTVNLCRQQFAAFGKVDAPAQGPLVTKVVTDLRQQSTVGNDASFRSRGFDDGLSGFDERQPLRGHRGVTQDDEVIFSLRLLQHPRWQLAGRGGAPPRRLLHAPLLPTR